MISSYHNRYGVEMSVWKLEARLLSRRRVTDNNCWEYTFCKDSNGYPVVSWKDELLRTHRFAYWYYKMKGKGKLGRWKVRHSCDNPACFNPGHLFRGTQKQNVSDSVKRGRTHVGSACSYTSLTEADVVRIRKLRSNKGWYNSRIAKRFSISESPVWLIVTGINWKHVGGPIRRTK